MTQPSEQTVYIVDDDPGILKALGWLMASVGRRAETFSSAEEFIRQCTRDHAGCILTDIRMPGIGGLELQEKLKDRGIDLPVIVMTGHGDVLSAVRAMKNGAIDFIEKPINDQVLLDLIGAAFEKEVNGRRARQALALARSRYERLTPREREVTTLVADGKSSKEIARILGISPKTVDVHRASIMDKAGVNSIAELTKLHMVCK